MGRTNYSAGFETSPTTGIDLQALAAILSTNGSINAALNAGQTSNISENTEEINNLAELVDTNKTDITSNAQSLSDLTTKVGTNETTLTNLDTEVSANKQHIASNAATLSTLRTDFDEANVRLTGDITRIDGTLAGIDAQTIADNAATIQQIIDDNSEVLNVVGRVGAMENANTRTYANTYTYQALGEPAWFGSVRSWGDTDTDTLVIQPSLESVINYIGDVLYQFYISGVESSTATGINNRELDLTVNNVVDRYNFINFSTLEQSDVTDNFNNGLNTLKSFGTGIRFTNGTDTIGFTNDDLEGITASYGDEIIMDFRRTDPDVFSSNFIDFYKAFGLLRYDNDFNFQVIDRTDNLLPIDRIKFKVTSIQIPGDFIDGSVVVVDDTSVPGTIQVISDDQYTLNSTYEKTSINEVQLVPTPEQNPNVPALAVISDKFGDDDKVVDIVSGGTSHFSVTGSGKVDMRNGELRFGSATNDFEDNKFGGFTPELVANAGVLFIQFPEQAADANVIHKTYFDDVFSGIDFDALDNVTSGGTYTIPHDNSARGDVVNSIDFEDTTGQLTNSNIFAVSLDDGVVSVDDGTRIETGISDATNGGRLKGYSNTVRLPVWVLYNYALSGRIDRLNSRRLFLNTFVSRVKADENGTYYYEPLINIDNRITHFDIPVVDVPVFGDKKIDFYNDSLSSRLWRYYRLTSIEIKNRVKIVGTNADERFGDAYQIPPAMEVRANHASPLDPIFTVKSDYRGNNRSLFSVLGDGRLQGVTAIGTKDERVNTIFMNSELVFNERMTFSATNEGNKVLQIDTDGSMLVGSNKKMNVNNDNGALSFVTTLSNDVNQGESPTETGFADIQASGLIIGNYKLMEDDNGDLVVQKLGESGSYSLAGGVLRAGGIGVGNEFTVAKNSSGNITVKNGEQEMMALVNEA